MVGAPTPERKDTKMKLRRVLRCTRLAVALAAAGVMGAGAFHPVDASTTPRHGIFRQGSQAAVADGGGGETGDVVILSTTPRHGIFRDGDLPGATISGGDGGKTGDVIVGV
jgi:hypothetical protein